MPLLQTGCTFEQYFVETKIQRQVSFYKQHIPKLINLIFRWPDLTDLFDNNYNYYHEEVIYIHNIFRLTQQKLELMPSRFCKKYEISECELEEWTELLNGKHENYWYLTTYLMDIVNTNATIESVDVVPLK